jgi:hypothetical protein
VIIALFLAAAQTGAEPAYEVRAFDRALQDFERFCIAPLPSPRRFAEAMDGAGIRWRPVEKTPDEIFGRGHSWRAPLGQITYRHNPETQRHLAGPACHLEFRTDADYRHAAAAALVERRLALPAGTDNSNRSQVQMQWDMRRADGMHIRVFLSSNIAMAGGTGARLSISRRDLTPIPREESRR